MEIHGTGGHPHGDGIIDGFKISQETLDHLDPIKRAIGIELIRQGRWVFMPSGEVRHG